MELNFIIGRGRSGTTLLSKILDHHEKIVSTPENLFVLNLYRKYRHTLFVEDIDKLSFFYDLWLEKNMYHWDLDATELKNYLLKLSKKLTFAEISQLIYEYYALRKKSKACLVFDKNPGYSLFVKELIDLYPEAKFIHIVRNCKDNVLSYQNVPFEPNNAYTLSYRWKYYNEYIEEQKKNHSDKILTIKYEDLVGNPEITIKKICIFIGVDYQDSMMSFHEKQKQDQLWHVNLMKPLNTNNIDKWKKKYSRIEAEKMDYISKKMMNLYQYKIQCDSDTKLLFNNKMMVYYGYILSRLEKYFFIMPLSTRALVLKLYRLFNR